MANIVDSLIRMFAYVVMGALALFVVGFAAWLFNRFPTRLRPQLKPVVRRAGKTHVVSLLPLALVGMLYALGVIVNSASFKLLEARHEDVVYNAMNAVTRVAGVEPPSGCLTHDSAATNILSDLVAPVHWSTHWIWHAQREAALPYAAKDEVVWRNQKNDAAKAVLDPILEQERIFRGVAVCSFLLFVFSLGCVVWRLFWSLCLAIKCRIQRILACPLRITACSSGSPTAACPLRITACPSRARSDRLKPALWATAISFLVYWSSISGWLQQEDRFTCS